MVRLPPAVLAALCALAVLAGDVRAQCPDGTPPPCARPSAVPRPVAAPAPDPNRVAILPFRVTTSDTLLGEGFAELLATQFTGEGSPRAVDMATVLSGWRRAGGGLRAPLPRARAVQLARELGAGLVSEGSIVGLGTRVTVSASLIAVPGGAVRGTAQPVSGPVDSLDVLLRHTTMALLASVGGQGGGEGTRFTESPTAMRAYLEGLSAWRRGRLGGAAEAFDRAIADDSAFAQARYRRYLAANWGVPGRIPTSGYARLAWDRRAALSERERLTLETLLGPRYPAPRLLEERFSARRSLTERLPDSPDAWYFLADYYFHYGRAVEPTRFLDLARVGFERSAAIDSQATSLSHLVWTGIVTQDTALLRRTWPALERTDDAPRWILGWLAAATAGDAATLAALRRRPVDRADDPEALQGAFAAGGAVVPPALVDEMFERWLAATTSDASRSAVQLYRGFALAMTGRPAAAERVWATLPTAAAHQADELRLQLDLSGEAVGIDVGGGGRRLAEAVTRDSAVTRRAACLLALWRHERGDTTPVDPERYRAVRPRCAQALEAAALGRSLANEAETRLLVLDSLLHNAMSTQLSEWYDAPVIAHAWERRGQPARAAAASRHAIAFNSGLRLEGRLAAVAGDTVGAISAYRRWLRLTTYAEPVLQPRRDSVRAELARLEGRPSP